ncbi:MAG: bifunctional phosphopantothenoylcysteine decarboxylase/phosphopantothenate--cysteine ligase CoaBC [Candidatus Thermoplasmatota archaeon]|nr:bifunctional phosphopantothenoylcysteine decarboxylase/phosphopantothenate--cysteine ligase CoaBC [Candidatus Thermoplasmatota archaeon]
MHPSERIFGSKDRRLGGNTILLCVTGSIAATETVKLARELIRHGARVVPFMTEAACRIICPDALHFASGNEPVTSLTGAVEHISAVSGERVAVIVAPATADIIGKISQGLADDAVSALCLNALGCGVPMIVAPSMGASMMDNPFVKMNMERLRRQGINVLPAVVAENEAKLLDAGTILVEASRCFSAGLLKRRNVLVVGGAGEEPFDDVRFITSRSSGRTAVEIATCAYEQKANVMLWYGRMDAEIPSFVGSRPFRRLSDLSANVSGRKFDIVIVPASLPDFVPEKRGGKISSESELSLRLKRAPKFVDEVRDRCRVLVAFKAEIGDDAHVIESARKRMRKGKFDIIVANSLDDVSAENTRAHIIDADGVQTVTGTKRELAEALIAKIARIK